MTLVKVNNPVLKSFDGLLNELLNEIPSSFGKTIRQDFAGFPPVNVQEKSAGYHLQFSVPGFEKADFSIKLENNLLTITAAKQNKENDENVKIIRTEFANKSFKRSFTLYEKVDATNIQAKYENGILNIELPKKEEQKAATKEIVVL